MFKDSLGKLTRGESLSDAEVTEFIENMRDDVVNDMQIAGFLVALLMKGPTADEVAAIVRAMRANSVQIDPKVDGNLTDMCGTGGGLKTFNVSSANAIMTAAAGVPVAKHGSRSISAASGSADALEALGINVELTPEQGEKLIEEIGISFLYAPNFHPLMLKVYFPELAARVKTIFFTIIGPLINPAGAPHHVMGVYQPHLVELVGDAVAQLDMKHVVVAHGVDGLDEISILGPTEIAEVKGTQDREVRDHAGGLRLQARDLRRRQGRRPRIQRPRDPRDLRGARPGPAPRLPRHQQRLRALRRRGRGEPGGGDGQGAGDDRLGAGHREAGRVRARVARPRPRLRPQGVDPAAAGGGTAPCPLRDQGAIAEGGRPPSGARPGGSWRRRWRRAPWPGSRS